MPVHQNSLFAYHEQLGIGLGEKQLHVLNAIKCLGKCTDQQIADHLRWSINCVTPRRGELKDKGLIVEAGNIRNKFNRPVMTWEAKQ